MKTSGAATAASSTPSSAAKVNGYHTRRFRGSPVDAVVAIRAGEADLALRLTGLKASFGGGTFRYLPAVKLPLLVPAAAPL